MAATQWSPRTCTLIAEEEEVLDISDHRTTRGWNLLLLLLLVRSIDGSNDRNRLSKVGFATAIEMTLFVRTKDAAKLSFLTLFSCRRCRVDVV